MRRRKESMEKSSKREIEKKKRLQNSAMSTLSNFSCCEDKIGLITTKKFYERKLNSLSACLPQAMLVKFLMIVCLIMIEHVSHISSQQHLTSAILSHPTYSHSALALSNQHAFADTHRRVKRMDLEACLGQFDVHTNTIIRTGDSQAIGGKFLQGLELETIEQCQRLCCETESCDVYIFESKNGSYCYLFECGTPENFHCKFTRHANFTSAVFTPMKQFIEVTTPRPPPTNPPQLGTPNISQQEWELTSLKVKPETHGKLSELAAGISSSLSSNLQQQQKSQQNDIGFPQKVIANATVTHCGRFQFTCHSGECIAVYNACDGIPQCEDGSDEGPECSDAKSNVESNNAVDGGATQKYRPVLVQQTPQQQLQSMQQQQRQPGQTSNLGVINNREDANAWVSRKMAAETNANNGVELNSHIFTHKNGFQVPQNLPAESSRNVNSNTGAIDLSTGIGNYPSSNTNLNPLYSATLQRSGIYLPQPMIPQQTDGLYTVPQQQIIDQQGHIYVPPNLNWAQQSQQQQQQQQPQNFPAVVTPLTITNERGTSLAQGPAYVVSAQQQQQPQPQPHQQQQQQIKASYIAPPVTNDVMLQAPQQIVNVQDSSKIVQQKITKSEQAVNNNDKGSTKKMLGSANMPPDESYEEEYDDQSTEPPKKKQRKHKKVKAKQLSGTAAGGASSKDHVESKKPLVDDDPIQESFKQAQRKISPVHEQFKAIHENLAMEFRDHDGQSDRPSGAAISLTFGILITAALAILIGCRMRTVGRRARRLGKAPYSHEADFLVNGMYL